MPAARVCKLWVEENTRSVEVAVEALRANKLSLRELLEREKQKVRPNLTKVHN